MKKIRGKYSGQKITKIVISLPNFFFPIFSPRMAQFLPIYNKAFFDNIFRQAKHKIFGIVRALQAHTQKLGKKTGFWVPERLWGWGKNMIGGQNIEQ